MIQAVLVAMPARNEALRLPAALEAVRLAAAVCPVPVVVAVAADACTDASADIARAAGVVVVEVRAGRVGEARAAAIDAGLAVLDRPAAGVWIANTDADSRVPSQWLAVHLAAAARGAELLRGSVRPDARELAADHLRRWLLLNPPDDRHAHVHGTNLGVRADVYRSLGGFAPVADDEDVLLVRAAKAQGRRIESTADAPVTTSARLVGRTARGFARYLRDRIVVD